MIQVFLGGQDLVVTAHPSGLALHGFHHAPLEVVVRGAAGEEGEAVAGIPGEQEIARFLLTGAPAGAVRGQSGDAGQDGLQGLVQGSLGLVVSHALQEVVGGIFHGGADSGTARRDPNDWKEKGTLVKEGSVRVQATARTGNESGNVAVALSS